MTISSRIKTIRGSISQADFAKKIGVHISTLQLYESRNIPKGDIFIKIKQEFGIIAFTGIHDTKNTH